MKSYTAIKRHEIRQTRKIATALVELKKSKFNWRIIVIPFFLYDLILYYRRLHVLRKNLFFTKQLAIDASINILQGKNRAWEIRQIEIKTRDILVKEKKGIYTNKIRKKQLEEIDYLIDHYLNLFRANRPTYEEAVRERYPSKGRYLSFLNNLRKMEEEVIQAAITTMREGTKKERRLWFDKIRKATRKMGIEAADRIYAELEK